MDFQSSDFKNRNYHFTKLPIMVLISPSLPASSTFEILNFDYINFFKIFFKNSRELMPTFGVRVMVVGLRKSPRKKSPTFFPDFDVTRVK